MKAKQQQQAQQGNNVAKLAMKQVMTFAVEDALAVLAATDARAAADASFKQTAIERGKSLRRPNAQLGKENALHDLHVTYLDLFAKRLMKERNEGDKASPYVRRVKSDFAAILGAVQIHEAKVTYTNAKGKEVTETVNVAEHLSKCGKVQEVVKAARSIKTAAGFISSRGNGKGGEVKPIKGATLAGILSKLDGRLSLKTLAQLFKFGGQQSRLLVAVGNRPMMDKAVAEFMHQVQRIAAEPVHAGVVADKNAANPAMRQAANAKPQAKQRKAA